MTKVSVIGAAGTVGAAAGYNIALRDIADELIFVRDVAERDVVPGGGADGPGRADDANLCHSRSESVAGAD